MSNIDLTDVRKEVRAKLHAKLDEYKNSVDAQMTPENLTVCHQIFDIVLHEHPNPIAGTYLAILHLVNPILTIAHLTEVSQFCRQTIATAVKQIKRILSVKMVTVVQNYDRVRPMNSQQDTVMSEGAFLQLCQGIVPPLTEDQIKKIMHTYRLLVSHRQNWGKTFPAAILHYHMREFSYGITAVLRTIQRQLRYDVRENSVRKATHQIEKIVKLYTNSEYAFRCIAKKIRENTPLTPFEATAPIIMTAKEQFMKICQENPNPVSQSVITSISSNGYVPLPNTFGIIL